MAATLVLVACGLLASGIAVTSIMQHTLISRVDQSLLDASAAGPGPAARCRRPDRGPESRAPPSNFYVRGIDPDGGIWIAVNDREADPRCPTTTTSGQCR